MPKKAPVSSQVLKARKKLEAQIHEERKLITEKALRKMREIIKNWLERHSDQRVQLKKRPISLFDNKRHSERIKSKYIHNLLQKLKKETAHEKMILKSLKGRLTIDG